MEMDASLLWCAAEFPFSNEPHLFSANAHSNHFMAPNLNKIIISLEYDYKVNFKASLY